MDGPSRPTTPADDNRPCWECLRRRLVCDYTRPACRKCVRTGIVCPGYGNAKPLKWLTPGSVTFRRRKDVPTRSYPTSGTPSNSGSSPKSSSPKSGKSNSESEAGSPEKGEVQGDLSLKLLRADFKCDMTDLVQAVAYCMGPLTFTVEPRWLYTLTDAGQDNDRIYPDMEATSLCESPYVARVPLEYIRRSPDFLVHISASLSIRHRIYRLSSTPERKALVGMRLRYHQQRSLAIEALNENIARAEKEDPNLLIVGVNMFVFAEVCPVVVSLILS